jgi:hypothetical protein
MRVMEGTTQSRTLATVLGSRERELSACSERCVPVDAGAEAPTSFPLNVGGRMDDIAMGFLELWVEENVKPVRSGKQQAEAERLAAAIHPRRGRGRGN